MGLLLYLVASWGIAWIWHHVLSTRRQKAKRQARQTRSLLRDRLRWDADVLKERDRQALADGKARLEALSLRTASLEEVNAATQACHVALGRAYPRSRLHSLKEFVELFVVVFGVVAGLRGLFIQPFKIPTGSMQPTLYGIHFQEKLEPGVPGKVRQVFDFMNFSRRYTDTTIREEGMYQGARQRSKYLIFNETDLLIGRSVYTLPGDAHNVLRYTGVARNPERRYEAGDTLARGYLLMGDHLFVDRVSYTMREPRRGDVAVFITDGLRLSDGSPLSGRYYIKRMVGMPGDTLRITERHLYVKPRGETAFRVVDKTMHPAFEKIYSFKGGYRGHSHARGSLRVRYLTDDEATFTLGDDEYFMMGDNTESSQDSRFFGPVPRDHLVGKAFFVWWPFSRRWGIVDHATPEDYPSPPNSSPY